MPLNSNIVGQVTDAFQHEVDARWTMAYAAGLGDCLPVYMDTAAGETIAVHPLFPVCLEWPAILDARRLPGTQDLSAAENARNVHALHDVHLYQPVVPGRSYTTTGTVVGLESRKPGAFLVIRLDTLDEAGQLVCRTYNGTIYRGVEIDGDGVWLEHLPAAPDTNDVDWTESHTIDIAPNIAHVYTECARIWNPIHTDRTVALAAGLPDIILHGTASLALAISRIILERLGGDPRRINRFGGRFGGMVRMPSSVRLSLGAAGGEYTAFRLHTEGAPGVLRGGYVFHS